MINIPITFHSDEKGYLDRECPNENCLFTFKIRMDDWKEKVSDNEVHCPMCGHIDTAEKWWTQQQLEDMKEVASNWAMSYIQGELDKSFKNLERSTRVHKFIKITYKPGHRITFVNNPLGQSPEWEREIQCPKCATRYSVIGSAYFCPCCGYNGIEEAFEETLEVIIKMIESLPEMERFLAESQGKDTANTMCRGMLEGSLGDVVSAFQKFAELRYRLLTSKAARVNDFQIVEKGSRLFKEATGKGYDSWISDEEQLYMNLMFQRRHVIEHNAGFVDDQYVQKSEDATYAVGQRLVIHGSDTQRLIRIIKKLATGLKSLHRES
jgi:hypothetical protein